MLECIEEARHVESGFSFDVAMAQSRTPESAEASLTSYLLNDDTTVIAVSADLTIMCSMANAAGLLSEKTGLSLSDNRLVHADVKVQRALQATLTDTIARGVRRTVVVPGTWGHAWHMAVMPQTAGAAFVQPHAVLRIERRHIFRRPDPQSLESVLGLSQAEARMLCELISGHCVSECAEILGVSVATVRKHLAATLRKTCCTRQSELMRLASIIT
ncbi:helix-turn-helix transcriptional regulator [Burkholderia sp. Leaf177]|uniref:helix-turn-helix transcriptional regulator n=1 Tax=Burkholderia sp. Leaf177 TaxID=1736287 RepID=UPI000A8FCB17|nr:ArsR family transcriptional regulator [Burkholderia sp. Leaf177]